MDREFIQTQAVRSVKIVTILHHAFQTLPVFQGLTQTYFKLRQVFQSVKITSDRDSLHIQTRNKRVKKVMF